MKLAGLILCGLAGVAFAGMSSLLVTSLWITRFIGPALVLVLGGLLVYSAFRKPASELPAQQPDAAVEKPADESAS